MHVPPPEHPLIPQGEPVLISEPPALAAFLEHIREMGTFAFDTEFIGESTYQPRTCLIQLATSQRVALVDPLRLPDVSGIWEIVGDPTLATIVHAGASDLSPVRRHLGRDPLNLVDVQVAAGFAAMPYPTSLANLVERFAGHPLAKGHTFTDWDARPLSASQLLYAADDVRFLPLVWDVLRDELVRLGRLRWAELETMTRLDDPHLFDPVAHARRAARGYELTAAQEVLLRELCIARDAIARHENLPHRTTIPDGSLLEVLRELPQTRAQLVDVRGMPRPIVARHGDMLLKVLADNPTERTDWFTVSKRHDHDSGVRAVVDAMLAESLRACDELGIAHMLAVTRAELTRFAARSKRLRAEGIEPPPLFAEGNWRREAFGGRIEGASSIDAGSNSGSGSGAG